MRTGQQMSSWLPREYSQTPVSVYGITKDASQLSPKTDEPARASCVRSHQRRTSGMSSLIRLAVEILEDREVPLGLRMVACTTLLCALETGVEAPPGAPLAVWRFLLRSDASAVLLHRHSLQHPDVARDAVRVLLDRETGEGERDLALAVLRNSNVDWVTEEHIASIIDRVLDEGRARQIGFLIERVHEQRGIATDFLLAIRNRLAASAAASVRSIAVDVAGLPAKLDQQFVARMFNDPSPAVRAATADLLERSEAPERAQALVLIREHLAVEQHRSVISACLFALGSLVRTEGQRVRQ